MLCLVTGARLLVSPTGFRRGSHSVGCAIRSSYTLGVTPSSATFSRDTLSALIVSSAGARRTLGPYDCTVVSPEDMLRRVSSHHVFIKHSKKCSAARGVTTFPPRDGWFRKITKATAFNDHRPLPTLFTHDATNLEETS